jgi:hypothetical protein
MGFIYIFIIFVWRANWGNIFYKTLILVKDVPWSSNKHLQLGRPTIITKRLIFFLLFLYQQIKNILTCQANL